MQDIQAITSAPSKKKKTGRIVGIVLLSLLSVILLIVGSAFGYLLYITHSAALDYDDVDAFLAQEPLSFEERWSFQAQPANAVLRVNKADVYWVMQKTGVLEEIQSVNSTLTQYNAELTRYGFFLQEDQTYLTAELIFMNMKIPVKAYGQLSYQEPYFTFGIEDVYIGDDKLHLPLEFICEKLGISKDDLTINVPANLHPRMKTLNGFAVGNNELSITFPLSEEELLREANLNAEEILNIYTYYPEYEGAKIYVENGPSALLDNALTSPENYVNFRNKIMVLGTSAEAKKVVEGKDPEVLKRFSYIPDFDAIDQQREDISAECERRENSIISMTAGMREAYKNKRLAYGDTNFVNLDFHSKPVTCLQFTDDIQTLTEWFKANEARLVLAQNGPLRDDLPYLYEIPRANNTALGNITLRYAPALVFLLPCGSPAVCYYSIDEEWVISQIEESHYAMLMENVKIPIYALSNDSKDD